MKFIAIATALFASVALAAPSPSSPNGNSVLVLEARDVAASAACAPNCACEKRICRCASCNEHTCDWYDDGSC